jgi:hypothetical protein
VECEENRDESAEKDEDQAHVVIELGEASNQECDAEHRQ